MSYEEAAKLLSDFYWAEKKLIHLCGRSTKTTAAAERRAVKALLKSLLGAVTDEQINSFIQRIN